MFGIQFPNKGRMKNRIEISRTEQERILFWELAHHQ